MPSANTIRVYIENGYYHIYNRGVEKRRIFEDASDYKTFLHYLKIYLTPPEILRRELPLLRINLVNANQSEDLTLLAFCLMPNHFHLLLTQRAKDAITKFMRQLTTAYTMYFNRKYLRVGALFQGVFKACLVDRDEYLAHLSRYIHLNPVDINASIDEFQWSSYPYYLERLNSPWVNTKLILDYFLQNNPRSDYKNFVEESIETPEQIRKFYLDAG